MSDARRHVILGAGGFIGRALTLHLMRRGVLVVAVDRPGVDLQSLGVRHMSADIGRGAAMRGLLDANDIVYLLAGGSLPDDKGADSRAQLDATVGATLTLLDACADAKVGRVMFPSSGGTVYGVPKCTPIGEDHSTDPISAYGVQKVAIEKFLGVYRHLRGLDSIVMRIGNPYGPGQDPARGQGLVAAVIHRMLTGQPVEIWGDGEVVRDYLFIDDLAEAIVTLAAYSGAERVFNVGSGIGTSVNQIVTMIAGAMPDIKPKIMRKAARGFDVPANVLDVSRLKGQTGWSAGVPLREGVQQTVAWMRGSATLREGAGKG